VVDCEPIGFELRAEGVNMKAGSAAKKSGKGANEAAEKSLQYAAFPTALGSIAIVWRPTGIVGLLLPETSEERLVVELKARYPQAQRAEPPARIRAVTRRVEAAMRGVATSFDAVQLDLEEVTPFRRRVYEAARRLGWGQTCSYGELAAELGGKGSARAVGGALGHNPIPLIVPCHRVLDSRGQLGGFTAPGGVKTKARLLALEGRVPKAPVSVPKETRVEPSHKQACAHLADVEPQLGRFMVEVGPFNQRLEKTSSVFEALSRAIVHQQLNGKAAGTIWDRFVKLFPSGLEPERTLQAAPETLRAAGLSASKVLSVLDLARRIQAGAVPELGELRRMTDEEVIERLTLVRGVGRWTAEMFLMFRLGRLDVLPLDDFGVKKGFARLFGLAKMPEKAELSERGKRWAPYRSVASYYLWRAAELLPDAVVRSASASLKASPRRPSARGPKRRG
jgi:O-6-methylguanine DNA methyltransferase